MHPFKMSPVFAVACAFEGSFKIGSVSCVAGDLNEKSFKVAPARAVTPAFERRIVQSARSRGLAC